MNKINSGQNRIKRKRQGSLIVIAVGLLGLLLALGLIVFNAQNYLLRRAQLASATEAATLSCATNLSRIIVPDKKWGFISLSDRPACGKATLAKDGKSIPVVSLNSALASTRMELLLARKINNQYIAQEAMNDYNHTKASINSFEEHLSEAIDFTSNRTFNDWNGKTVDAYGEAFNIFKCNMPDLKAGRAKLEKFHIKLGWIENGSESRTLNCERTTNSDTETYRGFINYPVDSNDFYFAGVSKRSRLISSADFREADQKHLSSAVQITATLRYPNYTIEVSATALPQAEEDQSTSGSMVIHFPQGNLTEIASLKSLLEQNCFRGVKPQRSFAVYGDYPKDAGSVLRTKHDSIPWNLSKSVARATLDWVKTNHGRAKLASVLHIVNSKFEDYTKNKLNSVLIYDFTNSGECLISMFENGGFVQHTVSEGQSLDLAYGVMQTKKGKLGISIRNQVIDHDIVEGGKHAGQPLTNEMPVNYESPSQQEELDTQIDTTRCRLSYLKGGLAVGVELFVH